MRARNQTCQNLAVLLSDLADTLASMGQDALAKKLRAYSQAADTLKKANSSQSQTMGRLWRDNVDLRQKNAQLTEKLRACEQAALRQARSIEQYNRPRRKS